MSHRAQQHGGRHGFTLVEVIVGVLLTALIAGATTVSVRSMLKARDASRARQQAYERAGAAAAAIERDALGIVRSEFLEETKVQVASGVSGGQPADGLLMITRQLARVRGLDSEPEGGDFEVQYRLLPGASGLPVLWRRSDPARDQAIDAGGVATPLVPGVVSLSIEACDRENWVEKWDSDGDGMPYGLRIVVTCTDDQRRATAVVRKIVPLDRVPGVVVIEEEEDAEEGT